MCVYLRVLCLGVIIRLVLLKDDVSMGSSCMECFAGLDGLGGCSVLGDCIIIVLLVLSFFSYIFFSSCPSLLLLIVERGIVSMK